MYKSCTRLIQGLSQILTPTSTLIPEYDPCRYIGTDYLGGDLRKIVFPITEESCVNKCIDDTQCIAVTYVNPNPEQYGSGVTGCYLKRGGWTVNTGAYQAKMVSVDVTCIRNKRRFPSLDQLFVIYKI